MLTDRAEGLMRLSRVTKYALVALSALAMDGDIDSAASSMTLPAAILFLALMAWGPSWSAWGRTWFHQPIQTTLWMTAVDVLIAAVTLLTVRAWVPGSEQIPMGLSLLASSTMLMLMNRFLPAVVASILYSGRQKPRRAADDPPTAHGRPGRGSEDR